MKTYSLKHQLKGVKDQQNNRSFGKLYSGVF